MMAAHGVMSDAWMAVIAVVVLGQKLVGARPVIDTALALSILAFGVLIIVDPSSVPGLTPPIWGSHRRLRPARNLYGT
jgi:hypothetical protein